MTPPTTPDLQPACDGVIRCTALLADDRVQWKVHTYGLLKEIVDHSGQAILEKPISIFGKLLAAVGERAAELNDPKLNALMCQLTIYTVADPTSPDYDASVVREVMKSANVRLSEPGAKI